MIVYGTEINNLKEAYMWLREAWMYEPFNIYYEEHGESGYISIEPVRGNEHPGYTIDSLKDFERFVY